MPREKKPVKHCDDKIFLSYVAGILDGEGSFDLVVSRRVRVILTEKDGYVLDMIAERLGGHRYHRNKQKSWKENWKEQEEWCVMGKENCLLLCEMVLPYLILKKPDCLEFIKKISNQRKYG